MPPPSPTNQKKMALELLCSQTFSKLAFLPAFSRHRVHPSGSCSMALRPADSPNSQVRIHLSLPYTRTLLHLPSCGLYPL